MQELRRPDIQSFILEHEADDPASLVLSGAKYPDIPIQQAAAQIKARQKAKVKLPELYHTPNIIFPHGVSLEQCSSELTAKYKADIFSGDALVDLTGGFGIDTYYFSKKTPSVTHVEQNAELSELVKSNYEELGVAIDCVNDTAESYLKSAVSGNQLFYVDPARRDGYNQKVFKLEECQPDMTEVLPILMESDSKVMVKLSPMLDIRQALDQLAGVRSVHVVSVNNECKELLFVIDHQVHDLVQFVAVDIQNNGERKTLSFTSSDEECLPVYGLPQKYIYEPNASILKAGGFNAVAKAYGLVKLHRNSHLYTNGKLVADFPGRSFELVKEVSLNKKKIKAGLAQMKANITVRNYPQDVATIRKKLGIKEGGDQYILATTLMDGSPTALLCKKA